jgi:hypothetical protein
MRLVIILGILLIFFLFIAVQRLSLAQKKNRNTPTQSHDNKNVFSDLRSRAFETTPDKLELRPATDMEVYGVIMDWEVSNGTMTLVCFQTGDASIYLSSGGGFIGGIQHESVKNASKNFVRLSQAYVLKGSRTSNTALPKKDHVQFYLLTQAGIFFKDVPMGSIEDRSSGWLDLFAAANDVISEYRKISGK